MLSEPRARDERPPVFEFPAVGNDGESWWLPRERHDGYRKAFPSLNLKQQYTLAAEWLASNPTQRKTPRGMPRFLYSWLERAQNRPAPRAPDARCAYHRAFGTLGKRPPAGWEDSCPECKHARAAGAGRASEVTSVADLAAETAKRLAAQKPPKPWTEAERAKMRETIAAGRSK